MNYVANTIGVRPSQHSALWQKLEARERERVQMQRYAARESQRRLRLRDVKLLKRKYRARTIWPLAYILDDVAEKHGLTIEELKSPRRVRRISWPRQEAVYLLHQAGLSFSAIGKLFRHYDHSTSLYACEAYARRTGLPPP